jgi:beta-galactosidase/beta-glucuronidase
MKGTNRHCFWPETGRTLNDAIQLQDVLLLKEMNMNAVRCSHYPPDKKFLELCDSLGCMCWMNWQAGRNITAQQLDKNCERNDHPRSEPSFYYFLGQWQ